MEEGGGVDHRGEGRGVEGGGCGGSIVGGGCLGSFGGEEVERGGGVGQKDWRNLEGR